MPEVTDAPRKRQPPPPALPTSQTVGPSTEEFPQSATEATPARTASTRKPCVGLPVQYCQGDEVIPGVLQRQSRLGAHLWDVKVSPGGMTILITRAAVPFSETPKSGHWSFLSE